MGAGVSEAEVENAIDAWHDGAGPGLELHEYLGWTWDEYKLWVESGEVPGR